MNRMNGKRKAFLIGLTLITMLALLAACGKSGGDAGSAGMNGSNGKIKVVTSFYPIYFLAEEIGGAHAQVVNLIPAGVEPHEWSPKSKDLNAASKAQLFLYNGAGLEGWVSDFLQGLDKNSGVVTTEVSKGIELIGADGHANEGYAHGHEGEATDPHTWVSPKSALIMAGNIKNSFIQVDEANKADYEANYQILKDKLEELDKSFESGLSALPHKDIVTSHQAFGYLCRDYGLNQIAIMGLTPEAEPRAQDLLRIAQFVKENNVKTIFFEELVSHDLAETLAREADVGTMVLNPIEGLTPEQEAKGDNFVTLMEANLQNLKKALQ
jgi:zinc transport system substrate-binding protein